MIRKQAVTILLVMALLFSMTACGKSKEKENIEEPKKTVESTEESATEEETTNKEPEEETSTEEEKSEIEQEEPEEFQEEERVMVGKSKDPIVPYPKTLDKTIKTYGYSINVPKDWKVYGKGPKKLVVSDDNLNTMIYFGQQINYVGDYQSPKNKVELSILNITSKQSDIYYDIIQLLDKKVRTGKHSTDGSGLEIIEDYDLTLYDKTVNGVKVQYAGGDNTNICISDPNDTTKLFNYTLYGISTVSDVVPHMTNTNGNIVNVLIMTKQDRKDLKELSDKVLASFKKIPMIKEDKSFKLPNDKNHDFLKLGTHIIGLPKNWHHNQVSSAILSTNNIDYGEMALTFESPTYLGSSINEYSISYNVENPGQSLDTSLQNLIEETFKDSKGMLLSGFADEHEFDQTKWEKRTIDGEEVLVSKGLFYYTYSFGGKYDFYVIKRINKGIEDLTDEKYATYYFGMARINEDKDEEDGSHLDRAQAIAEDIFKNTYLIGYADPKLPELDKSVKVSKTNNKDKWEKIPANTDNWKFLHLTTNDCYSMYLPNWESYLTDTGIIYVRDFEESAIFYTNELFEKSTSEENKLPAIKNSSNKAKALMDLVVQDMANGKLNTPDIWPIDPSTLTIKDSKEVTFGKQKALQVRGTVGLKDGRTYTYAVNFAIMPSLPDKEREAGDGEIGVIWGTFDLFGRNDFIDYVNSFSFEEGDDRIQFDGE